MKSEWQQYAVGDICTIKHGFAFKGIHFCEEQTKYIVTTPGNFALGGGFKLDKPKYYNGPIPEDFILSPGDIIVTMTDLSKEGDTLGYSALVPSKEDGIFLHNQRIGLIENISPEIDKTFLYWMMRTHSYQRYVANHSSGSTVRHSSPTNIGRYKFYAPSINNQRKIASILSAYDDLIENNNKRIKILEKMAENLYKEWFVRFRFPSHEQVEIENGIPKGWSISKLREIVQIRYGKDHKCIEDGEIPVFGSGGIMRYGNRALYSGETVMIPRKGSLNNVMYYKGDLWTVDTMFYTEFKRAHCAAYLYYVLAQYDLESLNTGASIPSLSTDILYHLRIIMPSQDLLARFEESLVAFNREKDNLLKKNELLTKQRDMLLPRLMNGKLKV